MSEPVLSESYACPRCGQAGGREAFARSGYQCGGCGLELAHLDVSPTGSVRGVIGWLRSPRDVLQERYQITTVLGRGGFAVTYLVEDLRLKGKRRALKEIPVALYDEAEMLLLSRLHHFSIPDIIDRFEADGMTYLVLEFGGQRTLEDERRRQGGTIPVDKLLPWMRQLCDVLSYLHGQNPPIVHRDLKPENVLLDERDRIMLIDFGIAKESGNMAVTRTIARSVTHGFSPPEQALGTGTDERSDVYALGATMYALLTGKAPPAAHERVAGREVDAPRGLNPSIPAALEAAIVQALSLNMNHRQASISELARMCEPGATVAAPERVAKLEARTERLTAAAPATRHAPVAAPAAVSPAERHGDLRRLGYLVAAVLLVAIGAVWFVMGTRKSEEQPPATTASSAPPAAVPPPAVEVPVPPAGGSNVASLPPSAGGEAAPAVVPPRVPPRQSDSATRALEEALASRRVESHGDAGPAIVTAPSDDQPPAPPRVVPVPERVRAALKERGLADVTVEMVHPKRLRLGNLKSEAVAQRAKEVAASVVDASITIEAPVAQARAERPRPPAAKEPAQPAPAAPAWGAIRREGVDRAD